MSGNGDGMKTIVRIDQDQNGSLKVVFGSEVSFKDLSLGIRLASLELDNLIVGRMMAKKPTPIEIPQSILDKIRAGKSLN